MKRLFLYLLILSIIHFSYVFPHSHAHHMIYIVIHGTWASTQAWSKPGGDFFDELVKHAAFDMSKVIHFTWSGKLDNKSRLAAGKDLAQFIKTSYAPNVPLSIVAHSHGANVGIIASQELAQTKHNRHTIEKFYALAAPVNITDYMPNMQVIHHFYNLFSLQDYVQPVLGIFGRVYPEHPRIANIRILLEGKSGSHSQMHDPMLARWIPFIHEYLSSKALGNFHTFNFGKPGTIYFFKHGEPYYREDRDQDKLLRQDQELTERMITTLSRSQNIRT